MILTSTVLPPRYAYKILQSMSFAAEFAQGNSVIMYRDAGLRRYQYYVNPSWMGGVYASPSIAGSRY